MIYSETSGARRERGCTPEELNMMQHAQRASVKPVRLVEDEAGEASIAHGTLMIGIGDVWDQNLDKLQEAVACGAGAMSLMPKWDEQDDQYFVD